MILYLDLLIDFDKKNIEYRLFGDKTMNLLESYKGRLSVAESFYAKTHNNEKMSNQKKLVTAKMLENCNRFLNEAFENSVGTQRSDMGAYRKFALNLTTVAVPY